MTNELEAAIRNVKEAKARNMLDHDAAVYGSMSAALRALDCVSIDEAVKMLSVVQTISIKKIDGRVSVI